MLKKWFNETQAKTKSALINHIYGKKHEKVLLKVIKHIYLLNIQTKQTQPL